MGKHNLFTRVIAFRYLLHHDDFIRFKSALISAVRHYLSTPGEATLYTDMGFPINWSKITAYKK